MKSNKKLFSATVIIIFLLATFNVSAQVVNKIDDNNSNKVKEEPLKKTEIKTHVVGEKTVVQRNTPVLKEGTAAYLDEDDKYQGREKEILSNLTVTSIPSDFPKYDKTKGTKWYNEQIDNYYKSNPSIVKDSVRRKLGV
jgi:hypothetical protein